MNKKLNQFLDQFEKEKPNAKILFLYKAGSHFFKLNTDKSDKDFKGVYLPEPSVFKYHGKMLNDELYRTFVYETTEGTQNSSEDVDLSLQSLPSFLNQLGNGDFNCMEALYATDDDILIHSEEMKELMSFRENLLVNDISSFIGFFTKEYNKYGVNSYFHKHRLDFYNFLDKLSLKKGRKLKDHWDDIIDFSNKNKGYMTFLTTSTGANDEVLTVELAKRKYQCTMPIDHAKKALKKKMSNVSHRKKEMAETGKEWKGLYHAQRLVYEAKSLANTGSLELPFSKDKLDYLMRIKTGNIEKEELFSGLDQGLIELEEIKQNTISNRDKVQNFINKKIESIIRKIELDYIMNKKS